MDGAFAHPVTYTLCRVLWPLPCVSQFAHRMRMVYWTPHVPLISFGVLPFVAERGVVLRHGLDVLPRLLSCCALCMSCPCSARQFPCILTCLRVKAASHVTRRLRLIFMRHPHEAFAAWFTFLRLILSEGDASLLFAWHRCALGAFRVAC